MVFALMTPAAFAGPLVDASPDYGVLVNLDQWFAGFTAPDKPGIFGETIYTSPRAVVMLRTAAKGTVANGHYHAVTDEIVYVVSGQAEMLIDGEPTLVKAGDLHVNPRGAIHSTRVVGDEPFRFISVFTPPQPKGGDAKFVKEGEKAPAGLLDAKPGKAVVVNAPEWYAARPSNDKPNIIGETILATPRVVVMIRDAGKDLKIKAHYHEVADEIVLVVAGSGEMMIDGRWNAVQAGDLHVNARGLVHSTRTPNENLKFISIFAPPQPAGGDNKWME
jgi:quercetin dioxygenase-like cupin family protein